MSDPKPNEEVIGGQTEDDPAKQDQKPGEADPAKEGEDDGSKPTEQAG